MRKKYRYFLHIRYLTVCCNIYLCILFLLPMILLPLYSSGFAGGTYVCERVDVIFHHNIFLLYSSLFKRALPHLTYY